MDQPYLFFENLNQLAPEVPSDSILSRTFHEDERLKAILFSFAAGQELSEHTASQPAILHFVSGEADLTLGEERQSARPGTWVWMPAQLTHSVYARTPVTMLLLLYKE
jgi:quercetin dioxygenase-like cupin family protein